MPPDVVPGRDDVGARREELVGELGRQAEPVGGVLAVDDADVCLELVPERREPRLDRPAARGAEDVCEEEDPQGVASALAACTSRWTC
jgi:hypothetical protein